MLKYSYLVDVGYSSFRSIKFNPGNQIGQELFCKCGGRHKFDLRVLREVLLTDSNLFQSEYDLETVVCPYCDEVYDKNNKLIFLEPNFYSLVEINFHLKKQKLKSGKTIRLIKEKIFAFYSDSEQKLHELNSYDELIYNFKNKEISIFLEKSNFKKNNEFMSNYILDTESKAANLNFSNFNYIDSIFDDMSKNYRNVNYNNTENCIEFIKQIGSGLIDFKKILQNKSLYISNFLENSKIYLNKEKNKIERYLYVDDEFSLDGSKIKEKLNPSSYLFSCNKLAKIVIALNLFDLITIYNTKDFSFLEKLINSNLMVNSNVLRKHNATYPIKIIEICTNYNQKGNNKEINQNPYLKDSINTNIKNDLTKYFKISNIIYNNIINIDDIDVLKNLSQYDYLNKLQLEYLFQKYDPIKIYNVAKKLSSTSKIENFNFKNIEQIIKYSLFEGKETTDNLNIYRDTVNTIKNIVSTQDKVRKIFYSSKVSENEKKSFGVYLSVKPNDILECKNFKELRRLHDNMSILFGVFQDSAKVEAYSFAVEKHLHLNCEIDFYTFEVIPSAYELQKEHKDMDHCINTYIDNIISGKYLAIRVIDRISKEHSTLGLIISNNNINFDQLKSYKNSRSSKYLISVTKKFFQKNNINYKTGSSFDLIADESIKTYPKEVLSVHKSNLFRMELLEKIKSEGEKIDNEKCKILIDEFHQLFINK